MLNYQRVVDAGERKWLDSHGFTAKGPKKTGAQTTAQYHPNNIYANGDYTGIQRT